MPWRTTGPRRSSSRSTATRAWPTASPPGHPTSRLPCCAATWARTCRSARRRSGRSSARSPVSSSPRWRRSTRTSAVIHAQRADREGNVQLWGIVGVQKETVLASKRSLVTVEEIVDELEPLPGAIVLPHWTVTCVAEVPRGAHPSYAQGYYDRDNEAYRAWDPIARDRERIPAVAGEKRCDRRRQCRDRLHDAGAAAEYQTLVRRRAARRLLRRHRSAQHRGQPRAPHPCPEHGPHLRVRLHRLEAHHAAAVDRRRRAGRDGRLGGERARDLQLLASARAGSRSASWAPPRSTATPTSTPP